MDYRLIIPKEVEDQWADYVRLVATEIAVLGLVTTDHEAKTWTVDEIFLVPQQITGSEVDFVDRGLHYAIDRALAMDRLDDLRFCAHSHVNMATKWSSTDEDMIDKIGLTGVPWFLSLVSNKRGEHRARFDTWLTDGTFLDDRTQIRFDDLTILWNGVEGADDEARIKEIEQFCTAPPKQAPRLLEAGSKGVTKHPGGAIPGTKALRKYDDTRFKNDIAKERGAMTPKEFITLAKAEDWSFIEDDGPDGTAANGYGYLYFHNKGGTVEARRLATDEMIGLVIENDIPGDMVLMYQEDPLDVLSRDAWQHLGLQAV